MKALAKLGLILALASSTAYAEVTLTAPEEIPVLALNDQEVSTGFFRGPKSTFKLDAGKHLISVRYEQLFDLNSGGHDILKSAVVTVAATLEDGKQYRLMLLDAPTDYQAAKDYVNQPTIAIVDDAGQVIGKKTGVDSTPKAWLGKGLFNRVFDLRDNEQQAEVEQNMQQVSVHNKQALAVSSSAVGQTVSASEDTVAQLQQLWQQADAKQRQQFAAWLVAQSTQ